MNMIERRMLTAERLKQLRKEKGLSQKQLAEATCIAATTIGGYEQMVKNLTPLTAQILAHALDCSPEYLLGDTDQRH